MLFHRRADVRFIDTQKKVGHRHRGILALTGVAAGLAAGGARAVTPLPPLGPVSSHEYFGFNFANNVSTSDTVGTLDYGGQPGCGGVCTATTMLGGDPNVSVTATEVEYQYTGGGFATAELKYFVQYNNAPGTYAVTVSAHDVLSASGLDNSVQAYIGVGQSTGYAYNVVSYLIASTDCEPICRTGFGNYLSPAPIVPVTINLIANTPYVVDIYVGLAPAFDSRVQLSASLDPTFSTTAQGGVFTFSPGVTSPSAVPEPAAWVIMLSGLAVVGAALRRGRDKISIMDV